MSNVLQLSPSQLETMSIAALFKSLPKREKEEFINSMSEREARFYTYDWDCWARDNQRWESLFGIHDKPMALFLAGRGSGKTRTGAEMVKQAVETRGVQRLMFMAATESDAVNTMIEGESGIMSVYPDDERPKYNANKHILKFQNGAVCLVTSAESPQRARGGNNELLWMDELCAWQVNTADDFYTQGLLSLRKGITKNIITTTPKPTELLAKIMKDPTVHITTGSTYDNIENLSAVFINEVISKYEGTRIGDQELYAKILEDITGALWKNSMFRRSLVNDFRILQRIVVAVDPAMGSGVNNDDTGIMVCGLDNEDNFHVLEDLTGKYTPKEWKDVVEDAYDRYEADCVVAETNQGGELVRSNLRNNLSYRSVHAMRGKALRAEPVKCYYEQGKAFHRPGLALLEDEMTTWIPGSKKSPNRIDALVWGWYDLLENPNHGVKVVRL